MRRILHFLLVAAALSACVPLPAQPGFIELQPTYGVTQANCSQSLTAAGLSEAQAQAKFPKLWARYQFEGKTIAQMMQLDYLVAAENDAFWVGHVHSFTNVPFPAGSGNIQYGPIDATVNDMMWWPFGRIEGVGTFSDKRYNSVLRVDTLWVGNPRERNLIVSPTWLGSGAMAYHESAKATNLSLIGARRSAYCDSTYNSSGLVCWDLGEGSHVGDIRANDFNTYGVLCERGTPAQFDNITAFRNGRAAFGMIGTALANVTITGVLSGDENVWEVEMLPGHGREAGGTFNAGAIKHETSTSSEHVWGPYYRWTGGGVGYLTGQFKFTCPNITFASPWIKSGQLFYVDCRLTNGTPQNSKLDVWCKGDGGFAAFLVDPYWGYAFTNVPAYTAFHAVYDAIKGELFIDGVKQTPVPFKKNAGPLGPVRPGQPAHDFANATPQMQMYGPSTTPPPVTCTWVPGVETCGTCTNNTQTCTTPFVSSVQGCSPPGSQPPPTSRNQACGTPPPSSTITPASVLVLYDSDESGSQARANAYATAWGIPSANVQGVAVGNADDLGTSDTKLNSVRSTITASGKQWCVLVWDTPSRAGTMSITSALTLGRVTAYNSTGTGTLPTSALYQYTGSTPKTAKNLVPCFLLHSKVNTARTVAARNTTGKVYGLSANDGTGQPRGSARVAQLQALDPSPGYVHQDNRSGCPGECPGNNLMNAPDVLAYFGSMYKLTGMETNTITPGAFGDYVTSTGGNLPTGAGQTPITYLLDAGFAGAGGTVVEPWQGGGGQLADQFTNAQLFSSAYFTNKLSLGQAVWSSIKCPGRYLILGDPLCTPGGTPTEGTTPPPSGGTIATFTNVNITSQSFTEQVSWANVGNIAFMGLNVPTLPGIGYICGSADRGIGVKDDGSIIDNRGGTNKVLNPGNPVKAGVPWSGTVVISPPWSMTFRGAIPGTGIGLIHQCMRMEVKQ